MTKGGRPPRPEDFASLREYVTAADAYHDARPPSTAAILDRARRFANNNLFAADLQVKRIMGADLNEPDGPWQCLIDFQFLIIALTRLRRAAILAFTVETVAQQAAAAVAAFDASLPGLLAMRNVAEHADTYAADSPTRRQR